MEITGQILKENREKVGVTLNEVSLATKISLKTLEAIEEGDKSKLPALTFLRGFVRTYTRYLKLDEESIMQTFYEEMGTPKPAKKTTNGDSTEEEQPDSLIHPKKLASKYLAVGAILVLIFLILFVRQVVNKYEKEGKLPAPEEVQQIVNSDNSALGGKSIVSDKKEDSKSIGASKPPIKDEPEKSKTKVTIKKEKEVVTPKAQKTSNKKNNITNSEVILKKKKDKQSKPEKIEKSEAVDSKPKLVKNNKKIEKVNKPEEKLVFNPQEIIIEALDNTGFSFSIDKGPRVKVQLKASQIQVIKANSSVSLNLNDGGAISLTHNGRSRGVPGDLGRSIQLEFP